MDTNFERIKLSYRKYRSSFSLKFQLYKYLKNGCIGLIQLLLSTFFLPVSLIFIIELKVVVLAIKSGLAFQRCIYTSAAIILVSQILPYESDPNITSCLNTSYSITLVNKVLFLCQVPKQKISKIFISLKIKEIKTLKYKFV